jgi:hypothetical protein
MGKSPMGEGSTDGTIAAVWSHGLLALRAGSTVGVRPGAGPAAPKAAGPGAGGTDGVTARASQGLSLAAPSKPSA